MNDILSRIIFIAMAISGILLAIYSEWSYALILWAFYHSFTSSLALSKLESKLEKGLKSQEDMLKSLKITLRDYFKNRKE